MNDIQKEIYISIFITVLLMCWDYLYVYRPTKRIIKQCSPVWIRFGGRILDQRKMTKTFLCYRPTLKIDTETSRPKRFIYFRPPAKEVLQKVQGVVLAIFGRGDIPRLIRKSPGIIGHLNLHWADLFICIVFLKKEILALYLTKKY